MGQEILDAQDLLQAIERSHARTGELIAAKAAMQADLEVRMAALEAA